MNIEKIINSHLDDILIEEDGTPLDDDTEIRMSKEALKGMIFHCFDIVETSLEKRILEISTRDKYMH